MIQVRRFKGGVQPLGFKFFLLLLGKEGVFFIFHFWPQSMHDSGDPAWSLMWFLFPGCFLSCPYLYLYLWAGCDLALSMTSLSIRVCLFATFSAVDCSSCTLV